MGSNCCKGDVSRPIRSTSSIYSRYILLVILVAQESLSVPWILRTLSSRAGAALDGARFTAAEEARGGARLSLAAAAVGDSGLYTLQASNAAGSATSTIRLEVAAEEAPTGEDPPAFLRRLQDLTVKVGSRTRFLVEIISSTECKVTWYRNERRLLEAERVALARDGNFWCADVAAVSVDDAGRWTCTAENAGGRASCSAHLNVLVPKAYKRPEFVEELQALLTEQGTVSLECKVVGVPTPVLRWFKDSREIKAGDVFALTANAEDPTSLGTYTCEAVNCMGRAYSSSKVHVVGRASREGSARPSSSGAAPEPPPIFTKELEDAHVKICDHLTLGCHIVVPPWPRSVVWYNKEGKAEPGERYQVLEDGVGGYLLEIASAEWADEGEWKCVATSAGGRVGISTCYVAMDVPKNYRKPRFMENLQAVLTEEGLVSFECKVVGFPTPVLSWFKDGQELKPGDVYQLTGTNSLGSYCCIARNCMGQASSSAELTVEDIQNQLNEEEKLQLFSKNQAPKFIQGLKSVEAKIDEPFRFTIKVAIPPEPSVLWYRDDQPVDESTRCHLEKEDKGVFNLDIQNLEFLDQAEWKCVAMNDFGHSVTSCFLKLIIPRHYKKPRFLENLQAILSDEGAVNLECKVIGVPQPVLKWYKDGEELKPGDIHRIISGQDGTCCLGTYTCEAQNCMGIAASSASLLGFDDSIKTKSKKTEELPLQRQLSLSTIHEERTSQMYDTPVGDITIDDKGEISFSFDGKEVSVSLYETPDLTEEEALQIVEMYADQLSENVTEHNVVELPPLRFVKETSTSGNLLMEAIIIDVSPDYFAAPEEDLRTEADVEDLSIADENGPPMLSLDQDIDLGGEDYLENTMALLSDEKSDLPAKSSRKKSDSQRSGDDFFSLSRDQSLSEEKRDDDTNISESDLQSFASARSSGKLKSKSSKPSAEEGQESSEPTKTILLKDDLKSSNEKLIKGLENELEVPVVKPKRERRSSRGSRRSSTSSEKSISKSREELLRIKREVEQSPKKPLLNDDDLKLIMNNLSTSLTKVINDVQLIERDIILKSELMSSAATASRSLEIISSLIAPLSEIHSIADATTESMSESKEVTSTIFNSIPKPLKSLQQSLTIIEKCIDVESDNKTLVKKTCVSVIESCGSEVQKIISDIASIASKGFLKTEDKVINEIECVANEITSVIKFSIDTIQARSLLTQASEVKSEEPTSETKHLRDTQKAVFELKSPLRSLLRIVQSTESGKTTDLSTIKNSEVIMNDMSASIQGLQTALEQIESLSVKETSSTLQMYNTEIIETVMDSVLKLRESFEQLSTETKAEEGHIVLKETLALLKENLTEISRQIETVDDNVGQFDVLQSDNKLDVLQKMAQILIALENNLPRLEPIPDAKSHMVTFHKNLTKVLEKVIESNDATKYLTMMEICDTVNILNSSIKNLDADNVLPLASICNSLKMIQTYFVTNIFESELNCSILNNISDILVGIHKAINKAEEKSLQVDSEYIQEFSTHTIGEEIVNIILEHIDKTIAAVDIVKTIESTRELQSALTPILENISPVLEELRHSIGSIRSGGVEQEEYISEMSDKSFAQTIASPLCELNQNLIVLNQFIVENLDMIKEYSEVVTAIAEPLHELHTTLEILQQDVISQYRDDLTPYEVSVNMASVVQNLQSCIVMIQEQTGVEAAEEMSTLEDISGIKTSADTLPSDRLVLPTAEETTIEQSLPPLIQEIATTATALTLQTLNEHIMVLQTPEVIETLDILSQVSDFSSLKTIAVGLEDLHTGLEGILHPVPIEGSIDLEDISNISGLAAIAEPMQDLHQSLSILDTSNIPVYENFLDLPAEKIHSVIQNISEFKSCLEQCIDAVFPAMEIATNTIEISSKVSTLREVCEQLREIFETSKYAPAEMTLSPEVHNLELAVESLINATDTSKNIKIEQVKCITEELYLKVKEVQEDLIQFTVQAPEKLSQEAKLIQIVCDVETNIAVLEQYDFIDLTRASDITACASPQLAVEIDSESLVQIHDIAEHAVNVIQDYYQEIPLADLMIVEDFFKTCKNEFTILRCLITKATTHKKIIRLLQEFSSLQTMINNFTTKRLELHLSDDVNECLTDFLIHADECLRNVRTSLIKVIDSQTVLLINAPVAELESLQEFKNVNETNKAIAAVVKSFLVAAKSAKSLAKTLRHAIIEELLNPNQIISPNEDEISLCANMEEIEVVIESYLNSGNNDETTQNVLQRLIGCIHKHHDYKDAIGKGKILIILKCLADCVNIVQNTVVHSNILKDEETKNKLEKNSLNEVLAEMIQPLEALQTQLVNIREQVLSGAEEDTISIDITSTESIMQYMTELHKDIVQQIYSEEVTVDNESISLMKEVDKEIHTIQDSIKSMENIDAAKAVQEITKPMEEIGNSLHDVLSSEKHTLQMGTMSKEQAANLLHHIDQYIELKEIAQEIATIIKAEDVNEIFDIARQLSENIGIIEDILDHEQTHEKIVTAREEQSKLAEKLQNALSGLQVLILENTQVLAPLLNTDVLQRIDKVTAQLQDNLVALTGVRTIVRSTELSISSELIGANTIESINTEQYVATNIDVPLEDILVTTEMPQNTQEADVVQPDKYMQPADSTEKTGKLTTQTEKCEEFSIECVQDLPMKDIVEDSSISFTDYHEAVVTIEKEILESIAQIPSLDHDVTEQVTESLFTKSDHLGEAERLDKDKVVTVKQQIEKNKVILTAQDDLMRHVNEYVSDDIIEVVNQLSSIMNCEELKQSVNIAQELRESITALETNTNEVVIGDSQSPREHANLLFSLENALSVLSEQTPESLHELIPSVTTDIIEKVVTTTQNLKTYIASIISSQGDLSLQYQPSQQNLVLTTESTTDQHENERAPNKTSDAIFENDHLSNLESRVVGNSEDIFVEHNDCLKQCQEKDAQSSRSDEKEAQQAKVAPCIGVKESQQIDFEQEPLQDTPLTQEPDSIEPSHMAVTATMHDDLNELVVIEHKNILESVFPKLVTEESLIIPPMQTASVGEETREIDEVAVVDDGSKTKALPAVETSGILAKGIIERETLLQHINAFITDEITEIVNEISNITKIEVLKESVSVAEKLRESIMATDCRATAEEVSGGAQEGGFLEQAHFAQILQDSLSTLHTQVLDSAEIIAPVLAPNSLQKVSEIISLLQKDLAPETISSPSAICTIQAARDGDLEEYGSMAQLKMLLQDVNSQLIHTSNDGSIDFEDSEALKDTLDEVQTVIIKLKRDYDGAVNDTLNETLEDLECSVRSVQLQINEVSPPELLTEACATLQLLVENMNASQIKISESISKPQKTEKILEICSNETEHTIHLIDLAVKSDVPESSHLGNIVSELKIIKDSLKSLRDNFVDVDILIECGVSVIETLEKLEENIFSLDKQVDSAINLPSDVRDNIITAVHSVYGSISNMRSTVSSLQKRYMFENYGKPSQSLLHAIKNIAFVSSLETEVEKQENLKKVSKSIRKVLNHFEDVKFYINLDKTARLPSDAAFTKIILEELKNNIITVLYPRAALMGPEVLQNVIDTLKCVETNLTRIEPDTSLDVKNKIPMFKNIANEILNTTNLIRNRLQLMPDGEEINIKLKNNFKATLDDEKQQSKNEVTMQSQEKDLGSTPPNSSNGNEMISKATTTIISQVVEALPSPNLLFNTETSLANAEQSILLDVHVENSIMVIEPEKTLDKTQNNLQEYSVLNIEKQQTDAGVQVIDKVELDPAHIAQIMEDEMSQNLDQAEQLLREEKLTEQIMEDYFDNKEKIVVKGDLDELNQNKEVKGFEIGECSKTLIQLSQVENIVKDDENLLMPIDMEPKQETKEKLEENMLFIEQNTSDQSVNLFQSMSENDLLKNETVIKNEEQVKTSEDKTNNSEQISSSSEGNMLQFVSNEPKQVSQILEKDYILEIEEINLQKEGDENIKQETDLKENQESPCSEGIENSLKHEHEDIVIDNIIPIKEEASSLNDSDEAENIKESNELKQDIEITCSQQQHETEIKSGNAEVQIETELSQINKTPKLHQETEKTEYDDKINEQADIEQKIKETCQHIDLKEADGLPGRDHEAANKNKEANKEEEKSEILQVKSHIDFSQEESKHNQTQKIENESQEIEEKPRLRQDEELQTLYAKINETSEEAKADLIEQEENIDLQLKKQGENLSTGHNELFGKVTETSALKDNEYTEKSNKEEKDREQNAGLAALVETTSESNEKARTEAEHKISKKEALLIGGEENKTHFKEDNEAPKEETELEVKKIIKSKEKHEELSNEECEATKYVKDESHLQKDKEQKEVEVKLNKKEKFDVRLQEGTEDQEENIKEKNKHSQNETKKQPVLTEEAENLQRATADKKSCNEKEKEVEKESTVEKEEQEIADTIVETNSEADSIEMVEKQRIKVERDEQEEQKVTEVIKVHDQNEETLCRPIEKETVFKMENKTADKSEEAVDQKDEKLQDLLTKKYVMEIALNENETDENAEKNSDLKETAETSRLQKDTEIYEKTEDEKEITAENIKEAIELKEKEQHIHLQKEKDAQAQQETEAFETHKEAVDNESNEKKTKLQQQGEQKIKEEKVHLLKNKDEEEALAEKQDKVIGKTKVAADLKAKDENALLKGKENEYEALSKKENEAAEKAKEAADEIKKEGRTQTLEYNESHKKIADQKNKSAYLEEKEKDEYAEFAKKENDGAKNAQAVEVLRDKGDNLCLKKEIQEIQDKKTPEKPAEQIDRSEKERLRKDKNENEALAEKQNEIIEKAKVAADLHDKEENARVKQEKDKREVLSEKEKEAADELKGQKISQIPDDNESHKKIADEKNKAEKLANKQNEAAKDSQESEVLRDKEENARLIDIDKKEDEAKQQNKTIEKCKEAVEFQNNETETKLHNEKEEEIKDKQAKDALEIEEKPAKQEDKKGKERLQKDTDEKDPLAEKQDKVIEKAKLAVDHIEQEEIARIKEKKDEALAEKENEAAEKAKEAADELKRKEISRIPEDNESYKKNAVKKNKAADIEEKRKDENEKFAKKQNKTSKNEAEILRDKGENVLLQHIDNEEDDAKQQNETIEKCKEEVLKDKENNACLQKEKEEEIHDKKAKDVSKRAKTLAKQEEKEHLQKDKDEKESLVEIQDKVIEKAKVAADLNETKGTACHKVEKDEYETLAEKETEATERATEVAEQKKKEKSSQIPENNEINKKHSDKTNKATEATKKADDLQDKENDEIEKVAKKENEAIKNAQEAEVLRYIEENTLLQERDNKEDEGKQQNETIDKCKEAVDLKNNETEIILLKKNEGESHGKKAKDTSKMAKERLRKEKDEKKALAEKQYEVIGKAEDAADLNDTIKGDRGKYEALIQKDNDSVTNSKETADQKKEEKKLRISEDIEGQQHITVENNKATEKNKKADELKGKEKEGNNELAKEENEVAENAQEAPVLREKEENACLRMEEEDNVALTREKNKATEKPADLNMTNNKSRIQDENEDHRNIFEKKKRAVDKTKGGDLKESKKDDKEEQAVKDIKSVENVKKAANIKDKEENDCYQQKKDDDEALFKNYSEADEILKETILKGTEDDSQYQNENQDHCTPADKEKKPVIKEVNLEETEKDGRVQKKKESEEALAKKDIEAVEKAKTGADVKKHEVQKEVPLAQAELTQKANKENKHAVELKLKQENECNEENEIHKKTNGAVEEAIQAADLIKKTKSVSLQWQEKDKAELVKEVTKDEYNPDILHPMISESVKKSNIEPDRKEFKENASLQKENKTLDTKTIESDEIGVLESEQKEEDKARLLKEEKQDSLSQMTKEPLQNIKKPNELHEIEKKVQTEHVKYAKNENSTEEAQLKNIEDKERRRKKKEVRVKKGNKDIDKLKNTESIDKNEKTRFLNESEANEAVINKENEAAETFKQVDQKEEIILDEIINQNEKEGQDLATEQTKPLKRDKNVTEFEQKQKVTEPEKEVIELEVNQMDKEEEQVHYKKEKTRQRKPDTEVTEIVKQEKKEIEFQVKQKEDEETTFDKNIKPIIYVQSDSKHEINIANEKYSKNIDLYNVSGKNNYTGRIDIGEKQDDKHIINKNDYGISKKENGDASDKRREVSHDEHYIKEYQYVPTHGELKLEAKEKQRFIDHNHRDYTMEFARPTGYRERSFNIDQTQSLPLHENLGRNTTIYKANTIVLDSQLRSSTPPYAEGTPSRMSEHREKRVIRHKPKALSEARSTTSEVRTGSSRDSKRKPVFSTYLTDRTAVEGSRVKLTCSVLSSSDPKVTWYKNGVLLDNKLKYRTKLIDGLITLEVLNAVPSDSAEYSCTIENENGAVNSSANLKVYPSFEASPIPPTFTRSIRDTYHLAENELVLECRIRGQPLPTITWLKDDKSISADSRYQAYYLADGVCRLAIESPTPDDSGKYTCKAENSVWSDQIAHVVNFTGNERRLSPNLTTVERSRFNRQALESRRPHFTNVLTDYKVVKGGTIGLQVEIRGAPTRVEWLREGSSVTEVYRNAKTFVEQGLYTLALSDVTEKESGMYTCRAWSAHGNVDMNAAITVVQPNELEGKPATIVGRPEKDILISVGEDINISFRVQGEPKPKVIFMKGIRDITTSQRVCKMTSDDYVKFTLKRSVIADAGTYCVLARNAFGCDRAFVTVVVRQRASSDNLISDWTYPADDSTHSAADRKYKSVPERIPGEPRVLEGGHNWISLGWPKSEPRPSGPVLAYRVESWLIGKEGGARWMELGITPLNSFDVFNLKQGEEYHFRITPRNRYGWGESVQTTSSIGVGVPGERPEFSEFLPGQLKVLLGETARLGCSVKGKPTPDVVWMKNGHEVEDDDRRVSSSFNGSQCWLTIEDVSGEDEARYSCEATNVHGRASTYARVAVVADRSVWEADAKLKRERSAGAEGDFPPQFTMRLRDRRVQATYPVRLTCQVIGSPDPGITWFKDGEEVVPDSRRSHFQDEHFHTLEIAPTTLDDGGVYEAMARNSSGAVSCRCNLVVDKGIRAYVAPEFCCGLEPLYRLSDGEELRISAVVEAYPSVGVTWYRDGVRLRPSRRAIMTLDRDGQIELALAAVTPRDAGVYTCTASNEVGRASTSGKVEVVGADAQRPPQPLLVSPDVPYSKEPMFTRKPRSSEAHEGDTVIIECEVVGDPKPEVYWLRDFLKPDYYRDSCHLKRLGEGPQYRFEIPHAKLDYTGAYSVVARNNHGEAKAVISLQILARDPSSGDDHNVRYGRVEVLPRFDRELTDLLSCDGDAVEFQCRVSAHPEPDVRWFHYHELIRECADLETSFGGGAARLKIKQVTAEDEGAYTCEAANSLGKATSSACLVVYPPGEPNTLSQRLRRPPALLSAASTPRSTPRTTPARSVSRTPGPEPRGLCSPARTAAPSFYTYPFNKVVEESDGVAMQCAVKGNPAPWATWDKDGVIITPSARITIKEKDDVLRVLEIDRVTTEDVGVYRITIENEFGRAEASARLEVITHAGKFYAGVRAASPGPRRSLAYRSRRPSAPRED